MQQQKSFSSFIPVHPLGVLFKKIFLTASLARATECAHVCGEDFCGFVMEYGGDMCGFSVGIGC